MKKILLLIVFSLIAASLPAFQIPAFAQQAPAAQEAKPPAPVLPLAPLANQLGQTLQTLVGAKPEQPASAADTDEDNAAPVADTFATGVLNTLAQAVGSLKAKSASLTSLSSALPDFIAWLGRQGSEPRYLALWTAIGNDLLIIVGAPLLIGIAVMLLLIPLRLKLRRNRPRALAGRIGLPIGLLAIRIVPVIVFLGAALLLLNQNETHRLLRFIILNVIYALSLGYTIQQILRGIFAPQTPHLRPLPLETPQAVSAWRWLSSFSFVIVCGYFLVELASALRAPADGIILLQDIFAVVLATMAAIVIFKTRTRVAKILRGKAEEAEEKEFATGFGFFALRGWLARHWHHLATVYLAVSLAVTLLDIDNGFALMLRGTILSVVILAAAGFGFLLVDQWKTPKNGGSPLVHRQILSFLLHAAIWVISGMGLAATWGVRVGSAFATPSGQRVLGAVALIALTLFLLTALYEMVNGLVERNLNRRDPSNGPMISARARTLLPMLRTSVFILFSAIALMTALSAVGFDIAPLLAGAGVIGVAIGFGSQTLIKDFLTGLFIVIENTIAVGDVVKIDSFGGVVEALSIRTIRLRDSDGSLHILPFSEVTKITNMSRGFAYALVDIGVSYDSDLERVMNVLREIGAALQEDPVFKRVILEPIEVMGVENLGDSSITIRARIRTRPGKQWDVRRLLLLRIKQRFDKEGIEIPFPTVTHIVK
ncbi:MAG: mechanosensitive ion channel [Alphaproteobacteria bacterium]|nr:mechanosensitive ion channel [Alphaproteobacteria bacterium]